MTKFTADDFAEARFAEREDGRFAARIYPEHRFSWGSSEGGWLSDEDMATTGWVPVREITTVSLDALHTAWENAEQADKCREGDVLILRLADGGYGVYPAAQAGLVGKARVLSRAPKREPWADLADMLRGTAWEQRAGMDADTIAKTLYAQGVRVTGGDTE